MSSCIKDLFDYELVKKCCRCTLICLKSNFYKSKNLSDGLHPQCISCSKTFCNENREKTRKYYLENRDKVKEYQLEKPRSN